MQVYTHLRMDVVYKSHTPGSILCVVGEQRDRAQRQIMQRLKTLVPEATAVRRARVNGRIEHFEVR